MPEDRRKCIPSMVTIMEISVYLEINGTLKQKWETFTDLSDAKNRKKEVEYKESVGTFVVPQCKTLNDLLPEYVALFLAILGIRKIGDVYKRQLLSVLGLFRT